MIAEAFIAYLLFRAIDLQGDEPEETLPPAAVETVQGAGDGRVFTDRQGRIIEADALDLKDGQVKLRRRADHRVFWVAVEDLAAADRDYLKERFRPKGTIDLLGESVSGSRWLIIVNNIDAQYRNTSNPLTFGEAIFGVIAPALRQLNPDVRFNILIMGRRTNGPIGLNFSGGMLFATDDNISEALVWLGKYLINDGGGQVRQGGKNSDFLPSVKQALGYRPDQILFVSNYGPSQEEWEILGGVNQAYKDFGLKAPINTVMVNLDYEADPKKPGSSRRDAEISNAEWKARWEPHRKSLESIAHATGGVSVSTKPLKRE